MELNDRFYMDLALKEAWRYQLLTYPNPAVGCTVVKDGKILAVEAHQQAGESHAEVRAMLIAYEALSGREVAIDPSNANEVHNFLESISSDIFKGVTLYVTLEPCSHQGVTPSCAWLLSRFPLKRVVIALRDPIKGHNGGIDILTNHNIDVEIGVCEKEAKELLEPFIIWQNRAFVLFKLAQTANGRIGGGYLSSQKSLEYVHRLREVANELVIGGSTVRVDRPRLDCRFTNGVAPDVTIYSRESKFDKTIPLFSVDNRRVTIRNNLETLLSRPSLLLVEGGEGMLNALAKSIDWLLLFQTPKLSSNALSYNINQKLEYLHQDKIDVDIIIWSRFE